ncbi:MAG: hypothetical protein RLZZ600_877 [Actinomycetota bacterium]|jgi:hypothetical protein
MDIWINCPRCGSETKVDRLGAVNDHFVGKRSCKLSAIEPSLVGFLAAKYAALQRDGEKLGEDKNEEAHDSRVSDLYVFKTKSKMARRRENRKEVVSFSDAQGKGFRETSGGAPGLGKRK